jgi:dihydropteroate synthase
MRPALLVSTPCLLQLGGQPAQQRVDLVHPVTAQSQGEPHVTQVLRGEIPVGWYENVGTIGVHGRHRATTAGGDHRRRSDDENDEQGQEPDHDTDRATLGAVTPNVTPTAPVTLRLGSRAFPPGSHAVMAIVNRTPDSFYDRGATYAHDAALAHVEKVVAEGADIVDIGGVKAGHGDNVDSVEELGRIAEFVSDVRALHPGLVISVDTWRSSVAREVCLRGADLLNDTWAGADPEVASVAAEFGTGLVCTHTGGLPPRTDPHRVAYDDVVAEVVRSVSRLAERAVRLGVRPDGVLVDPTHDFGKNTWHSLELTRRLDELVATGWPVLVALSNKDFIGETLDLPPEERLPGTLAATAIAAWNGARVFRAHEVPATRQVLAMVASIKGTRAPAVARRGLA